MSKKEGKEDKSGQGKEPEHYRIPEKNNVFWQKFDRLQPAEPRLPTDQSQVH